MTESLRVLMEEIDLPALGGARPRATLAYLVKCAPDTIPPYPFRFLHTVRSGTAVTVGPSAWAHEATSYYRELSRTLKSAEQWSEGRRFDVAMRAPSSRHDAEPYLAAIMNRQDEWEDLTRFFDKPPTFRSGGAGTFSEAVDAISCRLKRLPSPARELLIVDDVFSRGYTPAAIVHHLRSLGLPTSVHLTVFAPVWMQRIEIRQVTLSSEDSHHV